jgi:tetratricopeptide (TPR) repeat protein
MSDPYIKTRDFWNNFRGYKVEVDQGLKYESSTGWNEKRNMIPIIFPLESEAETFVKALSVLKQHAIKEKKKLASEASSFADFQEKAKTWRALKVKPDLPEDVRRFRVLAEDAIKHQEFEKAVQYYEQGLAIEPLWPQGQYNAALLYGEMKEYRDAELHMKRYLELVPDAPDAQAARDQMMIWQSRMKQ